MYEPPGLLGLHRPVPDRRPGRAGLRDLHWTPLPPPRLPDADTDIFAAIQTGDPAAPSSVATASI